MAQSAELKTAVPSFGDTPGDPHVVVFGNEKGGTGKTTTAMHIAIALSRSGARVSAIDLDGRQRTFARYIENRAEFVSRNGQPLPVPGVQVVERAKPGADAVADEQQRFSEALTRARAEADFVIIDTPGNDTNLSRLGHAAADTLVTPLNDSFLDFDLLAKFDSDSLEIKAPSLYAEFVWECRKRRLMASRGQPAKASIDWVVMRNRVSSIEARNKRRVATAVEHLSARLGCRVAPGFSERVIFRELFPMGLTMLDLPVAGLAMPLTLSHIAARQEVRELLAHLRLPGIDKAANERIAVRR
jgi:chromosome partitioning protein